MICMFPCLPLLSQMIPLVLWGISTNVDSFSCTGDSLRPKPTSWRTFCSFPQELAVDTQKQRKMPPGYFSPRQGRHQGKWAHDTHFQETQTKQKSPIAWHVLLFVYVRDRTLTVKPYLCCVPCCFCSQALEGSAHSHQGMLGIHGGAFHPHFSPAAMGWGWKGFPLASALLLWWSLLCQRNRTPGCAHIDKMNPVTPTMMRHFCVSQSLTEGCLVWIREDFGEKKRKKKKKGRQEVHVTEGG